jgi:hypothetical protein
MQLKLDEDGKAVVKDGKPVYVVDGEEVAYDVPAMVQKISDLNHENAERRVTAERLDADLKAFKGIDPKSAREALKFREALGDGGDPAKVAEEIASIKAEREGLVAQLEEANDALKGRDQSIWKLTVSNAIKGSEFVRERLIEAFSSNPELVEKLYGDRFKVEDGKPVAYDHEGKKVMSTISPGHPAGVDEALAHLIQDKRMLRADNASGGGSDPTASGGNGQVPTAKKAPAEMSRAEKLAFIKEHGAEAFEKAVVQ